MYLLFIKGLFGDVLSGLITSAVCGAFIFGCRFVYKKLSKKKEPEELLQLDPEAVKAFVERLSEMVFEGVIIRFVEFSLLELSSKHWFVRIIAEFDAATNKKEFQAGLDSALSDEYTGHKFQVRLKHPERDAEELKYYKLTHPGQYLGLPYETQDAYVFETPKGRSVPFFYKSMEPNMHIFRSYAQLHKQYKDKYPINRENVSAIYGTLLLCLPGSTITELSIELIDVVIYLRLSRQDLVLNPELIDVILGLIKEPKVGEIKIGTSTLEVSLEVGKRQLAEEVRKELEAVINHAHDQFIEDNEENFKPRQQIADGTAEILKTFNSMKLPLKEDDKESLNAFVCVTKALGTTLGIITQDNFLEGESDVKLLTDAFAMANGVAVPALSYMAGKLDVEIDVQAYIKQVGVVLTFAEAQLTGKEVDNDEFQKALKEASAMFSKVAGAKK